MSRDDELAMVRQQMSVLADRVARLVEIISVKSRAGRSTMVADERLALLETLLWRLHRRSTRLKTMATSPAAAPPVQQSM